MKVYSVILDFGPNKEFSLCSGIQKSTSKCSVTIPFVTAVTLILKNRLLLEQIAFTALMKQSNVN